MPAAGNATEFAVMTCAPRVLVRPKSHHDRRNLPPQSQTRREHNMRGTAVLGTKARRSQVQNFLIRETDEKSICNPHESLTTPQIPVLIPPYGRSLQPLNHAE